MKIRLALLALLAIALLATACSSSDDDDGGGGVVSGSTSLAGTYRGAYAGDGSGAVTMIVGADGTLDVTAEVDGTPERGQGKVGADGGVNVGIGAKNGVVVTFTGSFANGRGQGTWRSTLSTSGSWSVSK